MTLASLLERGTKVSSCVVLSAEEGQLNSKPWRCKIPCPRLDLGSSDGGVGDSPSQCQPDTELLELICSSLEEMSQLHHWLAVVGGLLGSGLWGLEETCFTGRGRPSWGLLCILLQ